jgi:hypothetical protein
MTSGRTSSRAVAEATQRLREAIKAHAVESGTVEGLMDAVHVLHALSESIGGDLHVAFPVRLFGLPLDGPTAARLTEHAIELREFADTLVAMSKKLPPQHQRIVQGGV